MLRLELRGVDVGDRWQTLATYLTPQIHEHSLPFQDLHYIYALARAEAGDLVTEMFLSMQDYAKKVKPCLRSTWVEITVPAARGMIAHATEDWESAIAFLRRVLPQLHRIGGSHAQRDVFEQVYLDAWLRAEQNHEALHLLQKRMTSRRYIPLDISIIVYFVVKEH